MTDAGARAEIRISDASFQLGSQTALEFMSLDDHNAQVRLSEGNLHVRVRRLRVRRLDENFEKTF
jgi:hypothetical protein